MGPKWLRVPSECLLIYWIGWFDIPKVCLGLFSNLEDRRRPVDTRLIILGILGLILYFVDPFSTSRYGFLLVTSDGFWVKLIFSPRFYVLKTSLLTRCLCDLEVRATLLTGNSFIYGLGGDGANVLYSFYNFGTALASRLGVFLGISSIFRVKYVSLKSMLLDAPICDLHCTRSIQFGGIVTYLMNGTVGTFP